MLHYVYHWGDEIWAVVAVWSALYLWVYWQVYTSRPGPDNNPGGN